MGVDEREHTDVHYRSLNGEGNFNWRLIFPFGYIPAEGEIVVKKKEHFWSLDITEQRFPPVLCMQVTFNHRSCADIANFPILGRRLDRLRDVLNQKKLCSLSMCQPVHSRGLFFQVNDYEN